MQRLTLKTSTIFIARDGRTSVFRSLNDVPPKLRKKLDESTNSFNSATILIADRRGRQEIVRALSGLPSALRSRVASSMAPQPADEAPAPEKSMQALAFLRDNWLEIALPGAVGLIIWAAFYFR